MQLFFPIICGLIVIYFLSRIKVRPKKGEYKVEHLQNKPVLIEINPNGTKRNPVRCRLNSVMAFAVIGFADYKKEKVIELNGSNIIWHNYMGKWDKRYGIDNVYHTPNKAGYQDIWISYKDKKINTSSKVKILVEV